MSEAREEWGGGREGGVGGYEPRAPDSPCFRLLHSVVQPLRPSLQVNRARERDKLRFTQKLAVLPHQRRRALVKR